VGIFIPSRAKYGEIYPWWLISMPSHPQAASQPTAKYYARFSGGQSAPAEDASASFGVTGVEIQLTGPFRNFVWPYGALRSTEPIRTHAINVLLSNTNAPGASVFVPGPEFSRALKRHAPHLTARSECWRKSRVWLAAAAAAIALFTAIYAAGWSPAHYVARILPQSWREKLGNEAAQSMTGDHKKCVAPGGVAALSKLTERLSKAAGMPFNVQVFDWTLMNAFAVPGSQIVMTRGMIETATTPDELAGVLAHEMGHGIELHPEAGIIRAVGLATAVELMLGGSGGALANIGLTLAQLAYTRSAEHEADLQSIRLLKEAGISSNGLRDFFKRVEKIETEDGSSDSMRTFDMLRTHPPTAEREKLVRSQPDYPSTPALDETSWHELKHICSSTIDAAKVANPGT
jgi:beta-barrel assembly-enhancing protease